MAGNERLVTEYLFEHIGLIELKHLGVIRKISVPTKKGILEIQTQGDVLQLSTEDSRKKADIYVNDIGVSVKQSGSTFMFNRLQRAQIKSVFNTLGFTYSDEVMSTFDEVVNRFHEEMAEGRSLPWDELFEENDFYSLLKFLMMEGSPRFGLSTNPAKFILQAPSKNIGLTNIEVFSFDEYFNQYKKNFKLAIRRSWIGQISNNEHDRAVGLARKEDNRKWVYEKIVGFPRRLGPTGEYWREDIAPSERRTVYFISIEKVEQPKRKTLKGTI